MTTLFTIFNSMASQPQASFAEMKALNEKLSKSDRRLTQCLEAQSVGLFVVDVTIKTQPYFVVSSNQFHRKRREAHILLGVGGIAVRRFVICCRLFVKKYSPINKKQLASRVIPRDASRGMS